MPTQHSRPRLPVGIDVGEELVPHRRPEHSRGGIIFCIGEWSRGQLESRVHQYATLPDCMEACVACASPQSQAQGLGHARHPT